jgi:wobble nucleotide-excising tRNase
VVFQNGAWSATVPDVVVFDDSFVAQNVYSGIEVDTEHRQNLHELVLGAQGIALNAALQRQVAAIEDHNRDIKAKADAIPVAARTGLSVDAFCDLPAEANVDEAIRDAERSLAAAEAEEQVRQGATFTPLSLPGFDVVALDALLRRALPDLENVTAHRVQQYLKSLGDGGEAWVGDGMKRIAAASAGRQHDACPFCAQDLVGSTIIASYRAYFSEGYASLKQAVADARQAVARDHGGDVPAAFERAIRDPGRGRRDHPLACRRDPARA